MEQMKLKNKEQLAWVSSQEEERSPFQMCVAMRFELLPFEYCESRDFASRCKQAVKSTLEQLHRHRLCRSGTGTQLLDAFGADL